MTIQGVSKPGILIVEDSYIVAFHLQSTLAAEGYNVIGQCDSGEQALELVERHRPSLVLMDIMLNGTLDGVQTASLLRTRFNVPVIYITALTDKDTIQRAKITEPYGYLTKPFEDRDIFTVIEMALYKCDIELKLKQSEEKYASTVKSISDALIVIDSGFNVSFLNQAAENLLGATLLQTTGMAIFDVVKLRDEQTGEFPVNPLQCDILSQSAIPDNLTLVTADGRSVPVGDGSLSTVIDKFGKQTGLVIIFKNLTDKREHQRIVREFEKQRLAAILEGQEKERSRIAKDLHDGLGQILNAIKMNVTTLIQDKEGAEDLCRLLDEAIQESVRISENLLPAKLKDFDLATCLRSMCKQMHEVVRIPIRFHSSGDVTTLDQGRKVNLYRIAQEAVTNAIKHANANTIDVHLNASDGLIRLSIEDDGKGIHPTTDEFHHKGLANMMERTKILDGTFRVESNPEQGTLVLIETPVQLQDIYDKV